MLNNWPKHAETGCVKKFWALIHSWPRMQGVVNYILAFVNAVSAFRQFSHGTAFLERFFFSLLRFRVPPVTHSNFLSLP